MPIGRLTADLSTFSLGLHDCDVLCQFKVSRNDATELAATDSMQGLSAGRRAPIISVWAVRSSHKSIRVQSPLAARIHSIQHKRSRMVIDPVLIEFDAFYKKSQEKYSEASKSNKDNEGKSESWMRTERTEIKKRIRKKGILFSVWYSAEFSEKVLSLSGIM